MFLRLKTGKPSSRSLPHAGGGVSEHILVDVKKTASSPRRWGCFHGAKATNAELASLPHAGGGVSQGDSGFYSSLESSPRRWGCFCLGVLGFAQCRVFPTQVGVFLLYDMNLTNVARLPHAGGGVSQNCRACKERRMSSPRRWGCFSKTDETGRH